MSTYRRNLGDGLKTLWYSFTHNREFNRGAVWGLIIISALLAFEVFNFNTTQFALRDVLGDLQSGGMSWATVLAIAFCGIDFAGIARIFTPEQGADEPAEVWYLFGAWVLAAAMNATLTWWGVSVAIATHTSQGTAVVRSETIQTVVPIFVAIMVWVIRVLIISTFSLAGDRMFSQAGQRTTRREYSQPQPVPTRNDYRPQRPVVGTTSVPRPAGRCAGPRPGCRTAPGSVARRAASARSRGPAPALAVPAPERSRWPAGTPRSCRIRSRRGAGSGRNDARRAPAE